MEDAIVAVSAYGESLGVVLESVGRGLGASVFNSEFAALFEKVEGGVRADSVDASGSDVAGDTQVANVGFIAQPLEFADRDVVALVVTSSGEGEIGDCAEDDQARDDDLDGALTRFVRHDAS